MSEDDNQVDATIRAMREKGVLPPAETQEEFAPEMRPELPKIRLPGRNRTLAQFAKDVGMVMCRNGVYLRGEVPMVLNKQERRLKEMTAKAFRSYVDNHAQLFFYEAGGKDEGPKEVVVSMGKDIAVDTLGSFNFLDQQQQIRRLNYVPMPVIREDGALELLKEGYDYETNTLTLPSKFNYELMDIKEAATVVREFYAGFDLADKDAEGNCRSLDALVAALLTPFIVGLLSDHALLPMFIFTANTRRGGKSLLVKTILYTVYGSAPASALGKDEEELRKVLDTKALAASSFIFFDNVKRKISSGSLEAFLTQPTWGGRTMATQREFAVDKQTIVYVTSNHVETSPDIAGRALFIDLFVETTDVQTREFPVTIDDTYLCKPAIRQQLLSALWSMVHHWDKQGRPNGKKKLVSFEEWSRVVGGIVMAAGFGDPLVAPKIVGGNTEWNDMVELVTMLAKELTGEEGEQKATAEFKMQEIVEMCVDRDLFVEQIDGKWNRPKDGPAEYELKKWSSISFGKLMKEYKGRTFTIPGVGKVKFDRRGSKNRRVIGIERV